MLSSPGAKLFIAGAVFVGIGLILVQFGASQMRGCVDCEEDPHETIDNIAKASAEIEEEE